MDNTDKTNDFSINYFYIVNLYLEIFYLWMEVFIK